MEYETNESCLLIDHIAEFHHTLNGQKEDRGYMTNKVDVKKFWAGIILQSRPENPWTELSSRILYFF